MMQALRNRMRRNDGFTLIELVVVVAILGILAAVLTPRVLNAMDNAKENGARATGKTIQTAMERYMIAEDGYPSGTVLTDDSTGLVNALSGYASLEAKAFDVVTYTPPGTDADEYTLVVQLKDSKKTVTITPGEVTVANTSAGN